MKRFLLVQTTKRAFFISELAEQDQEGSLIRFFEDSKLLYAIPIEAFMWCEVVTKDGVPE